MLISIVGSVFVVINKVSSLESNLLNESKLYINLVKKESIAALDFGRKDIAESVLDRLHNFPLLDFVSIYDYEGIEFANYTRTPIHNTNEIINQLEDKNYYWGKKYLFIKEELVKDNVAMGSVLAAISKKIIFQETRESIIQALLLLSILLVATYFISIKLQSYISAPILNLAEVTRKIVDTGDFNIEVSKPYEDEIGFLYDEFNEMVKKIVDSNKQSDELLSQLTLSEERLKYAFEGANDGFFDWDLTTGLIYLSKRAQVIFEVESEILKFNKFLIRRMVDYNSYSKARNALLDHFENKNSQFQYEFKLEKRNGEFAWILTRGKVVSRDHRNKPLRFVGTHTDITVRKRIEEELKSAKENAEKANLLKTEFLAQVSHEIRSPINVILSFASLLKEDLPTEAASKVNDYFNSMYNAGQRIIRTIDLILNMAELQTGIFEPNFTILHLYEEVVIPIFMEYKGNARAKSLKLNVEYRVADSVVYADKYSVYQVVVNLVDNAIKYTSEGKIDIVIYEMNNSTVLDVTDTGIGISAEYLPNLFNAFSQEEQGYTRSFEGNGLGLALVKKYCEINNVDISVKSEKNKGTTFTLVFKKTF